jgi:hypothetical protein
MGRLRRDTKRFKRCALNSLLLAIEMFNRPHDVGRTEAVLMLLQHAFEMFLKAAIYEKRGTISESRTSITFGFDRCLGIARSDLHILNEDQAQTLSILDGLRDCAVHNLIELTEQALYVHTQVAVTLFEQILRQVFSEHLADHMPTRVLPISTSPPTDMLAFLDSEFTQIQELLGPGKRRRSEARGRLHHLVIMESNLSGEARQPTEREVDRIIRQVKRGDTWQAIFPSIAGVRLDTQWHGPTVAIRFTRQMEAAPVRIVREGMPGFGEATLVREVNLLDRYSMNLHALAQNLNLTLPKTLALIRYLNLQTDSDCYREFPMGKSSVYKRYSPEALRKLREALENLDIEDIWQRYRLRGRPTEERREE